MSYRRIRQSQDDLSAHKFTLRQIVKLDSAQMIGAIGDQSDYEIIRIMPREDDGKLFYRVKADGRPERAVQEFQLIPVSVSDYAVFK